MQYWLNMITRAVDARCHSILGYEVLCSQLNPFDVFSLQFPDKVQYNGKKKMGS